MERWKIAWKRESYYSRWKSRSWHLGEWEAY